MKPDLYAILPVPFEQGSGAVALARRGDTSRRLKTGAPEPLYNTHSQLKKSVSVYSDTQARNGLHKYCPIVTNDKQMDWMQDARIDLELRTAFCAFWMAVSTSTALLGHAQRHRQ